MFELFKEKVKELYYIIIQPADDAYKLQSIKNLKIYLNMSYNRTFGEIYYEFVKKNKEKGIVYTNREISSFIIKNSISDMDIFSNPFLRIIDPACGCGNILIACFHYLRKLYEENLDKINLKNGLALDKKNLSKHIIDNNLHGADIDELALMILNIDLFECSGYVNTAKFVCEDFLLNEREEYFDIFLGNPPYIGNKSIDKSYALAIKEKYKSFYHDKSDISYCFLIAALNRLKAEGRITFITSRYFLEARSGEALRKILRECHLVNKIVDFYGIRPFKYVGVDPLIIFLSNYNENEEIQIIKPLGTGKSAEKAFYESIFYDKGINYKKFSVTYDCLSDSSWKLIDLRERNIICKIENKCNFRLKDICSSFQGIITGCDKAFIVDRKTVEREELERDILKPWIKSSFIEKYSVERQDSYIIYSDLIDDEKKYKNCIKYISKHREKLQSRRECVKGMRQWYQLQWGRKTDIFEREKIIFPYKAQKNIFALDAGSYFSADIYCMIITDNGKYSYHSLIKLLNSKTYEFYFKTFGKKLGDKLYEYYPNNLMNLFIPRDLNNNFNEVDLYNYFGFTKEEISIIEECC